MQLVSNKFKFLVETTEQDAIYCSTTGVRSDSKKAIAVLVTSDQELLISQSLSSRYVGVKAVFVY